MDSYNEDKLIWNVVKETLLENPIVIIEWRAMLKKIGLRAVDVAELEYKYFKEVPKVKTEKGLDLWRQRQGIHIDTWLKPLKIGLEKAGLRLMAEIVEKVVKTARFNETGQSTKGEITEKIETKGSDDLESKEQSPRFKSKPTIGISIHSLCLNTSAPIFQAQHTHVERLFVEFYPFLDLPQQEVETHASTTEILPNKTIHLNFHKEYNLDREKHPDRVFQLLNLCKPALEQTTNRRIRFTITSDPLNDDQDCEDIGVGYVDMAEIMAFKKDLDHQNIPVQGIPDQTTTIGTMSISVYCNFLEYYPLTIHHKDISGLYE